ncbi:MAG TPA: hypothetical protein VF221_01525 [Chloroflexota bacterium]
MPVTRPSDEGKDRSQWWKHQPTEIIEEEVHEGPTTDNDGTVRRRKFEEEQHPVQRPT